MSKLVRDFIPTIIAENGKSCKWHVADEEERLILLARKIKEETTELTNAITKDEVIEEMADVLEVMEAIAKMFNITLNEVTTKKYEKQLDRGAFDNFIVLEKVEG